MLNEYTPLKHKLRDTDATRVVVSLVDGETRELRASKDTRKRWQPILEPLEKLPWVRVELFKGDTTVGIIDNPDVVAEDAAIAAGCCPACGRSADGDLDRMIRAQREAATWQDKSVGTALNTMSAALATLTKLNQLQLDAAMQVQPQLPSGADPFDDIASMPMLRAAMPTIVSKLLGSEAGATLQLDEQQTAMLKQFLGATKKKPAPPPNGNGAGNGH